MGNSITFTTPVGRLVHGSLYKAQTTDHNNQPLVHKAGPNAGQPRQKFYFAIAIPKGQETHWSQTPWGQQIWNVGQAAYPGLANRPDFAWKMEDGDSQIPNLKNKKPCDNEGWPGNWIMKLSNGFAPRIYRQEGKTLVQETQENFVKPGSYVEVNLTVQGNNPSQTPGVYLNPAMVCFRAYGPEISFGPDVNEAGFGQAPLPAGASMTPLGSTLPPPSYGQQAIPPPQVQQASQQATTPPQPPQVQPDHAFLQVKKMTLKAGAVPYEAFIAQGWNDEQLIQNGFMLP